jgi:hypothetical protein
MGRGSAVTTTTSTTAIEHLVIPLDGLADAEIRIGFGGGDLTVGPAEPGVLLSGAFEGGVIQRLGGPGRIALEPQSPGRPLVTWRPVNWELALSAQIPVDLRLDTGANRSTIDLTTLRIRRLEIHTGASETHVLLPSAGETIARIECGFASIHLAVPEGVAVRVRGTMGIGALTVDATRFPRVGDGWASPDFEKAADRMDISVAGGFGSVDIR